MPAKQADEVALEVSANDPFMPIFDAKKPDFSGMLISAVHKEGAEEKLHLLRRTFDGQRSSSGCAVR